MVKAEKNKNKKNGFSLAEMMISMLIISLFFVAATKLITHKKPQEELKQPHGFFECYYSGGRLYTHTMQGQTETSAVAAPNCNVDLRSDIKFINIHYINGNTYFNTQEPFFEKSLKLSNPTDLQTYYYKQYFDGTETNTDVYHSKDEFKAYLAKSHPQSNIYKQWVGGASPQIVLFISW